MLRGTRSDSLIDRESKIPNQKHEARNKFKGSKHKIQNKVVGNKVCSEH